jgi:hypothetical protein
MMVGSRRIRERIQELITEAAEVSKEDYPAYLGWTTSAQRAVHSICPAETDPYRVQIERVVGDRDAPLWFKISQVSAVLTRLLEDIDRGLLTSIENQAIVGTFDDFLAHGANYLSCGKKDEAAVIAGVVFEDTIRRICRLKDIAETIQKNLPLDRLFTELEKANVLTGPETRRARAAACLRNSAVHADWGQIKAGDVEATITFTRELMSEHLG